MQFDYCRCIGYWSIRDSLLLTNSDLCLTQSMPAKKQTKKKQTANSGSISIMKE